MTLRSAIESIGTTAQLTFITADGNVILTGDNVKDASTALNQKGAGYVVTMEFDSTGSSLFEAATQSIVNGEITADEKLGLPANCIAIILDNEIISYPGCKLSYQQAESAQIEGNFTQEEATNLAALIRGGALPVNLEEVQTNISRSYVSVWTH